MSPSRPTLSQPTEQVTQTTSQTQIHDIGSPPARPGATGHIHTDGLYHPSAEYPAPTTFFSLDSGSQYEPQQQPSRNNSYDSNGIAYSQYGSVPSTAHSGQSFGGGEEPQYYVYDSSGSSGSGGGDFAFNPMREEERQSTPLALHPVDDDRTPMMSDAQPNPIHPSQLPSPTDQTTIRAADSSSKPHLSSPFRSFGQQQQHSLPYTNYGSMTINDPQTFIDPTHASHAYYPHPSHTQPIHPIAYHPNYDPSAYGHMPMAQPAYSYYPQPPFGTHSQAPHYGPTRSRHVSPGESSMSSRSTIQRGHSISSEQRHTRPKLTKEDKRNIVELHRSNTSLRQEDIARQYGVDRSTISKIIIAKHRWTGDDEQPIEPPVRTPKSTSGRFPEVDRLMSEWMDHQIAAGGDVRDAIAREQAKKFALQVGLDHQRFKASAKWYDKFKERRQAAGKPITTPSHINFTDLPYGSASHMALNFPNAAPASAAPSVLSRSQSTLTLSSSSSSSQEPFLNSPAGGPIDRMVLPRTETEAHPDPSPTETTPQRRTQSHRDQTQSQGPTQTSTPVQSAIPTPTPQSRARSQSSPHTLDAMAMASMQTPSSGKHVRPSPLSLQRQNSYHGSSPSPRRPAGPSRANSSQGALRRSRPGSLAASAFGITALDGDNAYSPLNSPTASQSGSIGGHSHTRQKSECLTPFTASMATMALSPDVSEFGDLTYSTSTSSVSSIPNQLAIPPMTPMTPASATSSSSSAHSAGIFPTLNPDFGYGEMQQHQQHQHYLAQQHHQHQAQLHHQENSRRAQEYNGPQLSPNEHGQMGYQGQPGQGSSGMRSAPLQGYSSMPNKHYGQSGTYPGYSPGEIGQGEGRQGYPGQGEQRWT